MKSLQFAVSAESSIRLAMKVEVDDGFLMVTQALFSQEGGLADEEGICEVKQDGDRFMVQASAFDSEQDAYFEAAFTGRLIADGLVVEDASFSRLGDEEQPVRVITPMPMTVNAE